MRNLTAAEVEYEPTHKTIDLTYELIDDEERYRAVGLTAVGGHERRSANLTKEKLLARLAASKQTRAPVIALRIPAAYLTLARKQAEQKARPQSAVIYPAPDAPRKRPTSIQEEFHTRAALEIRGPGGDHVQGCS
jgi:hypothetical protein